MDAREFKARLKALPEEEPDAVDKFLLKKAEAENDGATCPLAEVKAIIADMENSIK